MAPFTLFGSLLLRPQPGPSLALSFWQKGFRQKGFRLKGSFLENLIAARRISIFFKQRRKREAIGTGPENFSHANSFLGLYWPQKP
jgi:hypothetical protein